MIIWINGAFGSGKTTTAFELSRRIENSFVYDPENVGYFIWKNAPERFSKGDFQDIGLWREFNYKMLKMICDNYDGTVIVPMTLVNPDYYDEIVNRLISDGVALRHFILYAGKETLVKRLNRRRAGVLGRESFAKKSISRCIYAFDNYITETKIMVDNMLVDQVVEEIARQCGIALLPDKRGRLKKKFDCLRVLARHIR